MAQLTEQLTEQDKLFEKTMKETNKPYKGMVETEKEIEDRKNKTPICPIMSWRAFNDQDQHYEVICYKEGCMLWKWSRKHNKGMCGLIK